MTELMHYADQLVTLDRARTYQQHEPHSFRKPQGFWVSVAGEDDWPSWCHSEEFCRDSLRCPHRVTLAPDSAILRLATPEALDDFARRYSVETEWERRYSRDRDNWPIDWANVVADYDGIIIAPYQWSRRYRDWYYGWDCASGCVWNLDAIESVTAVTASVTTS